MAAWLYDPRHPHRSKPRSSPRGPPPPNSASPTLPKTAVRQNWTGPRSSERGASSAAFRILRSCRKTEPKNGVGREFESVCGNGHQTEVHAKKGPPIGRFCRESAETAFSRWVESVQCDGRKFAPGGVGVWIGEGGGGSLDRWGWRRALAGSCLRRMSDDRGSARRGAVKGDPGVAGDHIGEGAAAARVQYWRSCLARAGHRRAPSDARRHTRQRIDGSRGGRRG
jgi:hypothetical protein